MWGWKKYLNNGQNYPNLIKGTYLEIQGKYKTPKRINRNKSVPKHIIIKILKVKKKEKLLKIPRENAVLLSREQWFN